MEQTQRGRVPERHQLVRMVGGVAVGMVLGHSLKNDLASMHYKRKWGTRPVWSSPPWGSARSFSIMGIDRWMSA